MSDPLDSLPPSRQSILPPGRRIGRYQLDAPLGDGAQGTVYAARRLPDGERVALKVIHRHLCGNTQIFKRFKREAQILKQLQGEHVVEILDFIEEEGLLAIVLEYVEGTSLEAWLKERGFLEPDEAIEVTLQVCAALGAAHAAGIVHRDLKPANVLIERPRAGAPSSTLRVKVVDFGVAKMVHGDPTMPSLTDHGMIFGTPEYMSPEQARGDVADARSDLYAAGVMLYEMVVGKVPFTGKNTVSAMMAHLTDPLPPPRVQNPKAKISPSLEAVIVRALAKNPAERYATARAFAEAIAAARDAPLVIRPTGSQSDLTEELSTSDTDLNLSVPGLEGAETVPAEAIAKAMDKIRQREEELAKAKTLPMDADAMKPLPPPAVIAVSPSETSRSRKPPTPMDIAQPQNIGWPWLVAAAVAAVVGVLIGVFIALR